MAYSKKIFALFILFYFLFYNISFGVTLTSDIINEIIVSAEGTEARFVTLCYYPFINNTSAWQNVLQPIFDDIIDHSYYTRITTDGSNYPNSTFYIHTYLPGDSFTTSNVTYKSSIDNTSISLINYTYNNRKIRYLYYNPSSNSFSSSMSNLNVNYFQCLFGYRSQYLTNFLNEVHSNTPSIMNYLNSMKASLLHISDVNEDILGYLVQISIQLSNLDIQDYSSDISSISNDIYNILQDNQTIISQNSSMIQQQEEINSNLETLNDNLMDDNFDNSNLNLPTNNTENSADSGINNIFNSMYNAFCTGVAQNIILPIPFTNKNITIEPDFLYNALYNSNANWLILFIQAFWSYLIGRFVVLDVNNKFNKIKSGNIENLENSNIKGDLL